MIPTQLPPWIAKKDPQPLLHIFRQKLCEELATLKEDSWCDHGNSEICSNSAHIMGNIFDIKPISTDTAGEQQAGARLGFFGNFKRLLEAATFKLGWTHRG